MMEVAAEKVDSDGDGWRGICTELLKFAAGE